jgi:hypothetical protein
LKMETAIKKAISEACCNGPW